MNFRAKALAIALLFVGLILINYLASSVPARVDATADRIYSLSEGTKAILAKIEDPVALDLYFSTDASGLPVAYKNYAARVQEMLRQFVRASHGKLKLNVINPRADTPEEEKATALGLTPQVSRQGGDSFYFGLVVTQAEQVKTIPVISPPRESFLEYDVAKLIHSVQQLTKPKLGLITGLPLEGSPRMMAAYLPQAPKDAEFSYADWQENFEIVRIDAAAAELPKDLDLLAVVHPQNVGSKLQYRIDQFLLSGKPVVLAVDPSSQYQKRNNTNQRQPYARPQTEFHSDLPALLKGYGIEYDAQKVIGDLEFATQVQTGANTVARYPVWLNLRKPALNAKALPTAQLNSAMFIEAGAVSLQAGSSLTLTPLVETSAQAGDFPVHALNMTPPDEVAKQITATGKKTLAALVTGKFKTAFPNGEPKEGSSDPAGEAAKQDEPAKAALQESSGTSTLFIVADTDWLFDDYSVRRLNLFGQVAAEPINDNLALSANVLEYLSGSQDLISIRSKGPSMRPFDVVMQMEVEAQKKYQQQLTTVDARLQEVQKKLNELLAKRTEGNRVVATPEMTKAIEEFQKQSAQMRAERREIRRALREDIDRLENRLLAINLLTGPLLVGLFGVWFYRSRKK